MVAGVGSPSDKSSPRRLRRFLAPSADVAERQARGGTRQVQLDYAFDRLRASKLTHAYKILVPARVTIGRGSRKGGCACGWRRSTPGSPSAPSDAPRALSVSPC